MRRAAALGPMMGVLILAGVATAVAQRRGGFGGGFGGGGFTGPAGGGGVRTEP